MIHLNGVKVKDNCYKNDVSLNDNLYTNEVFEAYPKTVNFQCESIRFVSGGIEIKIENEILNTEFEKIIINGIEYLRQ